MIRPIHLAPLLLIALPLAACTKAEKQGAESVLASFGVPPVPDYSGSNEQIVALISASEVEAVEPVPVTPPAMVQVCWEEPRRAGTWFETVCEMRPAL